MVGVHGGENRCFSEQNHSGSTGEGSEGGRPAVSAPGGKSRRAGGSVDAEGLFEEMNGIADTGFLVAFGNRNDQYHDWAVHVAYEVSEPLLTCEAVLAETTFHLGDSRLVLDFVRTGLITPSFVLAEHLSQIAELARRHQDRRPDLADLCLVRMSEVHPKHSVITTDLADFRVYRRNRREAIPLIYPPTRS